MTAEALAKEGLPADVVATCQDALLAAPGTRIRIDLDQLSVDCEACHQDSPRFCTAPQPRNSCWHDEA